MNPDFQSPKDSYQSLLPNPQYKILINFRLNFVYKLSCSLIAAKYPRRSHRRISSISSSSLLIKPSAHAYNLFFICHLLGSFSYCYLIIADKKGVHSREALELAGLTSIAVDYPKTGIPAILRPELRASAWPDFMEKTGKTSYESTGIIGILYRSCTLDSFDFNFAYSVNKSLLLRGYEIYLPFAKQLYNLYSGKIHKLMRQYQSENEFFLLTVQNGENSKRKMRYEDDIQVQSLVSYFKEEVCSMFRDKTTDLLERRKIASACYFHVYSKPKTSSIKHVCLSFPWIFHDYLV